MFENMSLADLLAIAADPAQLAALTDEQLAELDAAIVDESESLAAAGLDDDGIELLNQAADAAEAVRSAAADRDAAAADRDAAAADALARLRGPADTDVDTDVDTEAEADADADMAADVPAPEPAPEPVPVAADTQPAPAPAPAPEPAARPQLSRIAARRPPAAAPRPAAAPDLASLGLVASANAPGLAAGQRITDYDQLAQAFIGAYQASQSYKGGYAKLNIVRAGSETNLYPESHQLDSNRQANMSKIRAAQQAVQRAGGLTAAARDGIQASGGICAPQQVRYDLPILGDDARPARDQFMLRFGADRGGISTLPPPVLSDLSGSVDVWTNTNDITPSDPTTKPCLTITCPTEDTTVVEAITRCLETGNFRARYFPEQIEAWLRLAGVEHARIAEQQLLAKVSAGSETHQTGEVLGTTRAVLASLDRAISYWRYVHRDPNIMLSWAAPMWLRDQIRTDLARQLPVATLDETLAVTDAQIAGFFAVRGIDPVWLLDGESGQGFVPDAGGPIQGYPSIAKTYLAPAGGWLFLDGGTLDLGIVRDSTLNSTNDLQIFAETFESAHFHGVESWVVNMDVCPDGSVSATVDIDPCTTGS